MPIPTQLIKVFPFLLTIFVVGCIGNPPKTKKGIMKTDLRPIEEKLNAFDATQETGNLEDAISLVEKLPDTKVERVFDSEMRRNKTFAFFIILSKIELSIDPSFSSDEDLPLSVAPPIETGLLAGIDPKAIEDRKLRKDYETALAANAKKMERHSEQVTLRRLKSQLRQEILTYVSSAYSGVPEAKQELTALSKKAGIENEFTAALESKVNH